MIRRLYEMVRFPPPYEPDPFRTHRRVRIPARLDRHVRTPCPVVVRAAPRPRQALAHVRHTGIDSRDAAPPHDRHTHPPPNGRAPQAVPCRRVAVVARPLGLSAACMATGPAPKRTGPRERRARQSMIDRRTSRGASRWSSSRWRDDVASGSRKIGVVTPTRPGNDIVGAISPVGGNTGRNRCTCSGPSSGRRSP